jgi:3',5'-cyclic AMP phosphodiesterase CpdA
MLIAQLSDLHLCAGGFLATKNVYAERAVDAVMRLDPRPDVVILTGDLTEFGTAEEYDLLLRLIGPLPMPVYAIPGNHDIREAMRASFRPFGFLPEAGPLSFVVETRPVRLIGLDSIIPGRVEGALPAATLDLLDQALSSAPGTPTLVFLHHPPMACGAASKDGIRLFSGAERLAEIVSRHAQVERIVAGHHHRAIQARFGGTLCQVAPPVRYMSPAERGEEARHETDEEPPGFLLHRWVPGAGLATHLCPLPILGTVPR